MCACVSMICEYHIKGERKRRGLVTIVTGLFEALFHCLLHTSSSFELGQRTAATGATVAVPSRAPHLRLPADKVDGSGAGVSDQPA